MCADSDVMRYMPKTMTREESSQQVSGFISHWEERWFGLWAVGWDLMRSSQKTYSRHFGE
jgi:hypothetical protein